MQGEFDQFSLDQFEYVQILMNRVPGRTILVYSGIFTFLVDAYPTFAASALAANSFTRSAFGGVFPLFGIQSKSARELSFLHTTTGDEGLCFACAGCPLQDDASCLQQAVKMRGDTCDLLLFMNVH